MDEPNPNPPPAVLYSPPTAEVVETFARRVCRKLGTEYTALDVVEGFSAFVKVVTEVHAEQLTRNQGGPVDNAE